MTVSGWGQIAENRGPSNTLQSVNVPGITNDRCNDLYQDTRYSITSNMLCAGDVENGRIDSCSGDSGGLY